MKVPIDEYACIDLDAPVLPSYEAFVSGSVYWLVWCEHCGKHHLCLAKTPSLLHDKDLCRLRLGTLSS
jgi:hypothetical protein